MESLIFQDLEIALNVRKQTLNGREFVVADVIILKEGVLHGSKGPLFYPTEEIGKRPGIWNGFPLTANHPMDGDKPASARHPNTWGKYTVGYLFNDSYDSVSSKRKGEIWVDIELANRVDKRIVENVLAGKPINVSTGLFTTDETAPPNSAYNGKSYTHIARNYQPDHLAILLDDKGACSVNDGCGINLNRLDYPESCPYCKTPLEIDPDSGICNRCGKKVEKVTVNSLLPEVYMRKELTSWLTTNCGCWKGKEAVLNDDKAFTDADLKQLKDNAEASTLAINTLKEVAVNLGAPKDARVSDIPSLAKNLFEKKDKNKDEEEEEMTPEEKAKAKKKKDKEKTMSGEEFKTNVLTTLKGLSEKEYLENAPPGISKLVESAKAAVEEKRVAIINKLTGHITNNDERKASILKLKDQSVETLNLMETLIPGTTVTNGKTEEEKFLANFFGAQGGSDGKTSATYNRKDVLLPSLSGDLAANDEEIVTEVS